MSVYGGPADWWTNGTDAGRTHIATKGIVQSGLVLNLDAGASSSYPGSGTTWTDLSSSATNSTLENGPTFSSAFGGGISVNGLNQYGVITNIINPFAETVIAWVSSATATWNKYGWITSTRAQNGHIIHPNVSTTSVEFFVLSSTAGITSMGSISVTNITQPHMYCYSTNGSNQHKKYLDGVLSGTTVTSITRTASPTAQTLYIGRDWTDTDRSGNGTIYVVTRYNRQLTDDEVLQNFNALRGRFGV
jgi:hypothetical protein